MYDYHMEYTHITEIGNGLYCRVRAPRLSIMDAYLKLQAECAHAKRDPKGTCYNCGKREGK